MTENAVSDVIIGSDQYLEERKRLLKSAIFEIRDIRNGENTEVEGNVIPFDCAGFRLSHEDYDRMCEEINEMEWFQKAASTIFTFCKAFVDWNKEWICLMVEWKEGVLQ